MPRPVTPFTGQWADVPLEDLGYGEPLSVEWEDAGMDRVHGGTESASFVRRMDFEPSGSGFDAAFDRER